MRPGDIAVLCLPDAAAKELVAAIGDSDTVVIDASTAHRVADGWTYGFPELAKDQLLNHLVVSTPGEPGKWFATAKTLKLFDQAIRLAWASSCEPKTLNRAARDHLKTQPDFAMKCALASLHWMSMGHGFELTGLDVLEAHRFAIEAAAVTQQARTSIEQVLASDGPMVAWMQRSLGTVR
mgnify:CR=1 FL=1